MKFSKLTTLILSSILFFQCSKTATNFISSGLEDVDEIRKEIDMKPTNVENRMERKASLLRWYRLLWRQGLDLDAFDSLAHLIIQGDRLGDQDFKNIDASYKELEKALINPIKINEVVAEATTSEADESPTDWPFYFGTHAERRGFSPDIGPQTGEIAWKYAKGYYWNAPPVLEGDKIYTSSPGIDVNAFCIDQNTGKTIWRGKQNGLHFYGEHASRWSPLITDNKVTIRVGDDSSGFRVFDKNSGKRIKELAASNTFGLMPYYRKGKTLALANDTGQDVWTYSSNDFFASEPLLSENQIIALSRPGELSVFNTESNIPIWTSDLESESGGSIGANSSSVFVGTNNSEIFSVSRLDGSINWTYSANKNDSRSRQFYSNPLLTEGLLYIGGVDGVLRCLDQKTGTEKWNVSLTDWIRSKPIMIGSTLYVATIDSKLHAINLSNQEILFTTSLGSHGITADLVGNENGIIAIGRGLMMYSVNPDNGNINWSRGVKDGAWVDDKYYFADWSGGLLGSPTIVDGIAYIGGPDGFVNALDVETGKEIWRFETGSTISIAPSVIEDKVVFGYLGSTTEHYGFEHPGEYFAVDRLTGELIWSTTEYGKIWVAAVYSEGILFMGNTVGEVFAINQDNGKKLWSYNTGQVSPKDTLPKDTPFTHGYPMGVYSVPTFDEENFYTGSWSGYYFAFNKKTGALKWKCETKGHDWGGLPDSAAPTLWEDHLYVQKKGWIMAAINKYNGKIEWEWESEPRGYLYNGTPAANNGRIFGSVVDKATLLPYNGKIVAFEDVASGGQLLWESKEDLGGLTAPVLTETNLISGGTASMFLTCLDQATGEVKWSTFMGGEMMENTPAIYGNKVFALSKNGYLYAIK